MCSGPEVRGQNPHIRQMGMFTAVRSSMVGRSQVLRSGALLSGHSPHHYIHVANFSQRQPRSPLPHHLPSPPRHPRWFSNAPRFPKSGRSSKGRGTSILIYLLMHLHHTKIHQVYKTGKEKEDRREEVRRRGGRGWGERGERV